MKKLINQKNIYLLAVLFALSWASCKVDKVLPVAESLKDVSGTWKILTATRNGADLTVLTDMSKFRVKFDAAGNYNIISPVPFVIAKDGKYSVDDPNYPFNMTFAPPTGAAATTGFNYPIISGKRQFTLTFSPGCTRNVYVYTLIKE